MDLGHSIFKVAAAGDAILLADLLENDSSLINFPDYDGNMPLHFAAASGSQACVELCLSALQSRSELDFATELKRKNFMGEDALTLAVTSSNAGSVSLLIDAGSETDYRYSRDVPPLRAALSQNNIEVASLILESFDVNFNINIQEKYWLIALKNDLQLSLEYFKLLRAHAVPLSIGDFEQIYSDVLEMDPTSKGLEDFLVYLCADGADRWSHCREEIISCKIRISSYFLAKLVPLAQNFNCVHRLQNMNLFCFPSSARAWLRVLEEWGTPIHYPWPPNIQRMFLSELSSNGSHLSKFESLVTDKSLIPLILYLATIAVAFPQSNWMQLWHNACVDAGFRLSDCNLCTLFERHTVCHSKSIGEFFWRKIFIFALSRAILSTDSHTQTIDEGYYALDGFLNHVYRECPSLHPKNSEDEDLFMSVLSFLPASSSIPQHELFLRVARAHLLPWSSNTQTSNVRPDVLLTCTVHGLIYKRLLSLILDFSAPIALTIICNTSDWPRQIQLLSSEILNLILLCHRETKFSTSFCDVTTFCPNLKTVIPSTELDKWVSTWKSKPRSLFGLCVSVVRINLRQKLSSYSNPVPALSDLIRLLPIAPGIQEFIIDPQLQ